MIYTIKTLEGAKDVTAEIRDFVMESGDYLNAITNSNFNWRNFPIIDYMRHGFFVIIERDGRPVGIGLARKLESIFDCNSRFLFLDLLHVRPGNYRATDLLLRHFIDLSKRHVNHIIMAAHAKTNIKGSSLKRLGFQELETWYRLET